MGGAVEGTEAGVRGVEDGANGGRDEMEDLPLAWPVVAGTDPKDFTSDLMGGAAEGDEDMGAETSSMDPKVTADPCLTAPTVPRGTLTPSFIGTP